MKLVEAQHLSAVIGSEMPHPCRAPRGLSTTATTRGLCSKSLTQRAQLRVLQPGDLPVLVSSQRCDPPSL